MKVLLAADGSDCSNAAAKEVVTRPWPADSEIRVISAFQVPLTPTPEAWAIPDDYYEEIERNARGHAQSVIEAARSRLEKEPKNHLLIICSLPAMFCRARHELQSWRKLIVGDPI